MTSPLDQVPLFPLPDGALLPGELLPLHVFEPRYREMLDVARAGGRLIAIATLLPGWETEYDGAPPIADVVGVGRIVSDRNNPDGTSDIVLKGLVRARIEHEVEDDAPFRRARLAPLTTEHLHAAELYRLRRRLLTGIDTALRRRDLHYDVTEPFDAAKLVDRISSMLELPGSARSALMHSIDLEQRIETLLGWLAERRHRQRLLEMIPSLHAYSLTLGAEP